MKGKHFFFSLYPPPISHLRYCVIMKLLGSEFEGQSNEVLPHYLGWEDVKLYEYECDCVTPALKQP